MKIENNSKILLSLLVVAAIFYGFNNYKAFDYDEAIYSTVAREMVESGDYLIPRFNYQGFYEKPIFLYWAITGIDRIFSFSDISYSGRLASAIATLVTILVIYYFTALFFNAKTAFLASMIYATSFGTILSSKMIITDPFFVLFLTISLFSFFAAIQSKKNIFFVAAYASTGLAVLTKGPVGAVIPLAAVFLYFTFLKKPLRFFSETKIVRGIIILALVVLPWFLTVAIRTQGEFIYDFIIVHNLQRFGKRAFEGHSGPFFFYIPIILLYLFPWSAHIFHAFRGALKSEKKIFLLIWTAVVLIIFSASKTKLPNYIMPLFPPLSVFLAAYLSDNFASNKRERMVAFITVSFLALILATLFFGAEIYLNINRAAIMNHQPFAFGELQLGGASQIIGFLLISVVFIFFFSQKIRSYSFVLITLMSLISFVLNAHFAPEIWRYLQGGIYNITELYTKISDADSELIAYDMPMNPSVSLTAKKRVTYIGRGKINEILEMREMRKGKKNIFIITKSNVFLQDLIEHDFEVISNDGGYILLR